MGVFGERGQTSASAAAHRDRRKRRRGAGRETTVADCQRVRQAAERVEAGGRGAGRERTGRRVHRARARSSAQGVPLSDAAQVAPARARQLSARLSQPRARQRRSAAQVERACRARAKARRRLAIRRAQQSHTLRLFEKGKAIIDVRWR